MNKTQNQNRRLQGILTAIGLFLVLAPLNTALIVMLFSLFRNVEPTVHSSVEGASYVILRNNLHLGAASTAGLIMFLCGIVLLGIVLIQQYRKKRSKK